MSGGATRPCDRALSEAAQPGAARAPYGLAPQRRVIHRTCSDANAAAYPAGAADTVRSSGPP